VHRTNSEVELAFDEFALEEVERIAGRLGISRERMVAQAVRHWLEEEGSGRLAAKPPPARRIRPHPAVPLAVDLAASDWDAIKRAAAAREIEPERLIGHAVLLLLADFDSGRIAARVAGSKNGLSR
jgi:hypothetical protein